MKVKDDKPLTLQEIDELVVAYRNALKSGTLCDRCLYANPPKSRYCADCGRVLGG